MPVNQKMARSEFIKPHLLKYIFKNLIKNQFFLSKESATGFLSATVICIAFTNMAYVLMPYINEKAPYFYEANYFVLFASTNKTKPNKLMKLKDK